MKRFAIVLCLALAACGKPLPAIEFPTLPDLSAETRTPCPDLPPVTGSYADLVTKDKDASVEYAKCQKRAATAVGAYQDAQAKLAASRAKADKADTPK